MSDVVSSRSRDYQSNNPNVYKPSMTNAKVSNSPVNDISRVPQRYRNTVSENQSRNTPNSRQENSPYSRRHNTKSTPQQDYVSDAESSRRHRTPESPRKHDPHVSSYGRPPPPPPQSMYSVTPPSTAEVLRTDNLLAHKQNRPFVGQQYSISHATPEYGRRAGYKTNHLDPVNSSLNSSNLSSVVYNSSPYKQITPSSVHIDKNQPSNVFSGSPPKAYNTPDVNARLYSPHQVSDSPRQSTQENVSYGSSGYPANRSMENSSQLYNMGPSPSRGNKGGTSYNQGHSYTRGDRDQSPYYDPRGGPPGRQQYEHSPYDDRGRSASRIGSDQQHHQGRSPNTAVQNYSAYNGHAGMPSRTDFTSANSSLNNSQVRDEYV
jgi:hypothetical protein